MSVDGFIESLGEVNIELESMGSAVQNAFSDEMVNQFTHKYKKLVPKCWPCIGVHQFIESLDVVEL